MGSHTMHTAALTLYTVLALHTHPAAPAAPGGPACRGCLRSPPFPGGRTLYLPHCVGGETVNHCDALCQGLPVSTQTSGSCDRCEDSCSQVFRAVCSQDQTIIFSNQCVAKCSGLAFTDCEGVGSSVIPGKSPLPPLPPHLQDTLGTQEKQGQF